MPTYITDAGYEELEISGVLENGLPFVRVTIIAQNGSRRMATISLDVAYVLAKDLHNECNDVLHKLTKKTASKPKPTDCPPHKKDTII